MECGRSIGPLSRRHGHSAQGIMCEKCFARICSHFLCEFGRVRKWYGCNKNATKLQQIRVRKRTNNFRTFLNIFDSIQGSRFLYIVRYPGMSHVKKSHSMNSLARGMSYVNQQVGVKTEEAWQAQLAVSCRVRYQGINCQKAAAINYRFNPLNLSSWDQL